MPRRWPAPSGRVVTFELVECADRKSGTYSGGQRRRLDLALGLVHSPRLVFLDEPTSGLDPQSRAHLWDWVRRLRDEGMTVFLTTHYLDEADSLCDRLSIIDHGAIVAEGTSAELKRQIAGDVVTVAVTGRSPDHQRDTEGPAVRAWGRAGCQWRAAAVRGRWGGGDAADPAGTGQ